MQIRNIAEQAGVSIMTVSNVLNAKSKVSQEKRELITRLLLENGYVPKNPDSLANHTKNRLIQLYCGDLNVIKTDLFFSSLMSGIISETSARGYEVLVSSVEKDENGRYFVNMDQDVDVAGIIITNPRENEDFLADVIKSRIPYVIVGRPATSQSRAFYVDIDNVAAAYNAAFHMFERGHRDILFLTGPEGHTLTTDRINGYKMAYRAYDFMAKDEYIINADYTSESAYEAIKVFLAGGLPITGVIANTDKQAIGAMNALHAAGLRVPEDVSLICCAESLLTTSCFPPITGIGVDAVIIGEQAAGMVIDVIERRLIIPTHIHLPFTLSERQTVLPIKNSLHCQELK